MKNGLNQELCRALPRDAFTSGTTRHTLLTHFIEDAYSLEEIGEAVRGLPRDAFTNPTERRRVKSAVRVLALRLRLRSVKK